MGTRSDSSSSQWRNKDVKTFFTSQTQSLVIPNPKAAVGRTSDTWNKARGVRSSLCAPTARTQAVCTGVQRGAYAGHSAPGESGDLPGIADETYAQWSFTEFSDPMWNA